MKVATFYVLGKSSGELLAFDEYDSIGSGDYFTDDLIMVRRFTSIEAEKKVDEDERYKDLKIYYVEIFNYEDGSDKEVSFELYYSPNGTYEDYYNENESIRKYYGRNEEQKNGFHYATNNDRDEFAEKDLFVAEPAAEYKVR